MAEYRISIQATPDAISPDWLTRALRHAGVLDRAVVVAVDVDPIAAGSGFVGQAARLKISYSDRESHAPATVFAKLSSVDPAVRQQLQRIGVYETEAGFYRDIASLPGFPMRTPRSYLNLYEENVDGSLLLLEDLGHAEFGNNIAGCSATDVETAVQQLALLHAYFWESPSLKRLSWLRALSDDVGMRVSLYRAMLPRFEQRCAEFLTPSLREAARRFASVLPEYFQRCSNGPQTFTHGDYRTDNLGIFPNKRGPKCDGS